MIKWSFLAVIAGFLLDLLIGDPHFLYHPVQMIGWLITRLERILRRLLPKTKTGERIGGSILVVLILGITGVVSVGLLFAAYRIHFAAGFVLQTFFCYQILATHALRRESMKVYHALHERTLDEARTAVSMIVGRDTQVLSAEGVTKAAVETVAENASDGVIAPLLYLMLGGAPLGFLYKAINTMDSMIGYDNDRYRYFGTAAAKLDDVVNFIPARLSACLMILACPLCGCDMASAVRIHRRDCHNHVSPNSAQTESVMAGALQIQLAGDAYYFGVLHTKPTIGDPVRPVCDGDIPRACRLLYTTAILSMCVFTAVRCLWFL